MIRLQEGELLDLLPPSLKNDIGMICLSHALKKATGRLLEYERAAMTQNFVDSLPEKILDVLAVELRSPYYLESLDIGVKRKVILNTLVWHTKAGTASAVSEMIGIVFGEGSVVEWPDFKDPPFTPGTFDIVTNAQMTEDVLGFFMDVIERVKNERSHVRRVLIHREIRMDERIAAAGVSKPKTAITNHEQGRGSGIRMESNIASGAVSSPEDAITNNGGERGRFARMGEAVAGVMSGTPEIAVTNNVGARNVHVSGAVEYAGVSASSAPRSTIGNSTASGAGVRKSMNVATVAVSSPNIKI